MKKLPDNAFLTFSEFERFWQRLSPESPYGKDIKASRLYSYQASELEHLWDQTEKVMAFIDSEASDFPLLDKIKYHLKRLPRFPESNQEFYCEIELFQIKKFLYHYKHLLNLLSQEIMSLFDFFFVSELLEEQLTLGQYEGETFYLADKYSKELANIRKEINLLDNILIKQRYSDERVIETQFGFYFNEKPFLIVPKEKLKNQSQDIYKYLSIDPFDEEKFCLRPLPSSECLKHQERRMTFQSQEQIIENKILKKISEFVRNELSHLLHYKKSLAAFDMALARSCLAKEFQLVRPGILPRGMMIKCARFLPCEESCQSRSLSYTPITADFPKNVNVLFGSNMGGKTVLLKSIAFLQLCVQTGLFVPAQTFNTSLFQTFHFLGAENIRREEAPIPGLSGFGMEIYQFLMASQSFKHKCLILFDEFAHTTNAIEAERLTGAMTEYFAEFANLTAFFSTHSRLLQRLSSIGYHRMEGINRSKLHEIIKKNHGNSDENFNTNLSCSTKFKAHRKQVIFRIYINTLRKWKVQFLGRQSAHPKPSDLTKLSQRIRHINAAISYRIVPDNPDLPITDALFVAEALGLPQTILAKITQ